jgi:hypothetical protein
MSESTQDPPDEPGTNELNDQIGLASADAYDPLIEAFKKDVDRTLLRENLKLTQEERSQKLRDFARFAGALRQAGSEARAQDPTWGLK